MTESGKTPWREISVEANLRLAQKMLNQQTEINTLRAELATSRLAAVSQWRWLASTRDLQRDVYAWDWEKIRANSRESYLETLGESIRSNTTALSAELGEFLQETGSVWKTWLSGRSLTDGQRRAAVEELVDLGHFLANIAVSLDVTDDEWETIYRAKQEKNRARQRDENGYDGVTGKCPRCRRAYDGAGVECRAESVEVSYSDDGGTVISTVPVRPYCADVGHYV